MKIEEGVAFSLNEMQIFVFKRKIKSVPVNAKYFP